MQCLKLSPLQSRFAASLVASIILLLLYLSLTKPHFAYAVELDSRIPPDHNHPIIFDDDVTFDNDDDDEGGPTRTKVIRQASPVATQLVNNHTPLPPNIQFGEVQYYVVSEDVVNGPHGHIGPGLPSEKEILEETKVSHAELRRRQQGNTVYITVNTCLQPTFNVTGNTTPDTNTSESIPQLKLYVSNDESNQYPGPGVGGNQEEIDLELGYALYTLNTTTSVFISIAAPNVTGYTGIWNYEVAASIDAPFHGSNGTWTNLFFVDGDDHAALLITNDTTEASSNSSVYQQWMTMRPPYGIFAHNQNDQSVLGLQNSVCGLRNNADIFDNVQGINNQNVASMTNRGLGGQPKEQFYITSLNPTSNYMGYLVMEGNSTATGNGVVGGGGTVWAPTTFFTKSQPNCALMYNLSFCSEVAYAVPSNPNKFSPETGLPNLAATYDHYAASMYQYFNFSLQQIPCNTTSSAQYSLARNCDDCARAYKQWLCAVTIPRCEDYNNTSPWLQVRNTAQSFTNGSQILPTDDFNRNLLDNIWSNSSRNPVIDDQIAPGPYKEVLPCQDLCWDLVQSCPASMGFGCPTKNRGLEVSYGVRSSDGGNITCSYLGAAYYLSGEGKNVRVYTALSVTLWVGIVVVFLAL